MVLYLVQHGEASPESDDPARPLTDRGRAEVERVARAAARQGVRPGEILHSGKLRAQQTAEVLAAALRPERGARQVAGLAPMDDPTAARGFVEQAARPLMLVGHLPHLSRLATLLLIGDASRDVVAFRMGGIVCLERGDVPWLVKWILVPESVP